MIYIGLWSNLGSAGSQIRITERTKVKGANNSPRESTSNREGPLIEYQRYEGKGRFSDDSTTVRETFILHL